MRLPLYVLLCLIALAELLSAQPPELMWERTYSTDTIAENAYFVDQTSNGDYVVIGRRSDDFALVRLDEDGDTLFVRSFGGPESETALSATIAMDDGITACGINFSLDTTGLGYGYSWVLHFSAEGDSLWSSSYGIGQFVDICATSDGGYALAGELWEDESLQDGEIVLLKTDANGDSLWSIRFLRDESIPIQCVVETSDGGLLAAGGAWGFGTSPYWVMKTTATGEIVWQHTLHGSTGALFDIVEVDDGYVLGGWDLSEQSAFGIVKIDFSGSVVWAESFGSESLALAHELIALPSGGFVLAGHHFPIHGDWENSNGLIIRVSEDGDSLWSQSFGTVFNERKLLSIALSADNGFVLAGSAKNFSNDSELWVLKLGPECGGLPPAAPELTITYSGSDIRLIWNPVEFSIPGCPVDVAGYRIYYRRELDDPWFYLGFTEETSITHSGILSSESMLFYNVVTVAE